MRKAHSPYGNVGPNSKNDTESLLRQRCNICDFCSGIDGRRQMFKDPYDDTGGYICSQCKNERGHESHKYQDELWADDVKKGLDTVDNSADYLEMIENLVTDYEKNSS